MNELAHVDKFVLRETFERAKTRADKRLELLRRARPWLEVDEAPLRKPNGGMLLGLIEDIDKELDDARVGR